jgi:uroporphyrin-3 C-methyltransferase/uroporphyrinogen III methyltransferase/synthase
VDSVGLALRLDNAIAQVDTLPMLADEKPTLPAAPESRHQGWRQGWQADASATSPWLQSAQAIWQGWSSEMWTDVRQLIRVRSVETRMR